MSLPENPKTAGFLPGQAARSRRFKTPRVIFALILREIESRDSRSILGFLWSFIEPVGTVLLLSVAFSLIMRVPPLGTNFPLFYLTGVIPFGMYAQLSSKTSSALRVSRPLLGLPAVLPLDTIFARFLLNYFIMIVSFIILMTAVVLIWDLRITLDLPRLIEGLLLAGSMGLGFGALNAVLFLALPAYENLWSILSRPLILASGVLIPVESIPQPYADWLWWNPVAHPVAIVREAVYPGYRAFGPVPGYVLIVFLVSFTLGLVALHRYVRKALEG